MPTNRRPEGRSAARLAGCAALALACAACGRSEPDPAPAPPDGTARSEKGAAPASTAPESARAIVLTDEAAARGLDYVNRSGEAHKPTILEANGAGVAMLDLGGDGDLDLVFSQGLGALAELVAGPGADLEVFENDGAGQFHRVDGPGLRGWWTGLATGDFDGDGSADLAVGGFGGLEVLLQREGRLARVPGGDLLASAPPSARVVPGEPREKGLFPAWTTSLAAADFDRDGLLDLYVVRYLDLDPVAPRVGRVGEGALSIPCRWKGQEVFCGPHGLVPQLDQVWFGRGDGRFEERGATALAGQVPSFGLGVAVFDADADGDSDVYVANDSVANFLWINDGAGRFQERAYSANVALSLDGAPEAGMGIAVGDVDRDGALDFALTNFSGEPTELYFGARIGFDNRTHRMGLSRETLPLLSWSTHLFDLDLDGHLELFTANGHVYPQADAPGTGTRYGQAATLWRLPSRGRVERVAADAPSSILAPELGARGSAAGDVDGDGDLDLALARIDGPAALGINRTRGAGRRVVIECRGPNSPGKTAPRTPRDGHGARVILRAGDGEAAFAQTAEVQTACGYQSSSSPWVTFGLGELEGYTAIEVLWPSGMRDVLPAGTAGRRLTIREGEGLVAEAKLK